MYVAPVRFPRTTMMYGEMGVVGVYKTADDGCLMPRIHLLSPCQHLQREIAGLVATGTTRTEKVDLRLTCHAKRAPQAAASHRSVNEFVL